jgi:hypothetical protein
MKQGRKSSERQVEGRCSGAVLVAAALLLLAPFRSAAAAGPDPQDLLKVARLASTQQEAVVSGRLRRMRFAFEKPSRVYEVRLDEETSGVFDAQGRPLQRGMREPVAEGTHVTVEDLSLGFLYWPDARLLGKETVRTRPAWKIELRPGKRGSEFAIVRVWLDEASGALLRIEGFDWQGHLSRRFEVVSGQRIDGRWMLKQMRIESFAPDNASRPLQRSYLEILGKEGL